MIDRAWSVAAGVASAIALASPAAAAVLPEPVRAMIARAAQSDDPTVFAAVLAVARQTNPESGEDIDRLAAELTGWNPAAAQPAALLALDLPPPPAVLAEAPPAAIVAAPPRLPPIPPPAVWRGSVELGGSLAQGSTETLGAYGVVDISRIDPRLSQRLTWRGDYQETDGRRTTQRFSAAYEPKARLSDQRYAFGLAQYEHDRFLGVDSRYTVGAGLGLQLANQPDFKVAVDLGPALRLTETRERGEERSALGRASLNLRWLPTERVTLSQETALYAEANQTSAKSITSLETLLFGPLKGRLSYNMQYERDTRIAREALDTTTRASVLYTF